MFREVEYMIPRSCDLSADGDTAVSTLSSSALQLRGLRLEIQRPARLSLQMLIRAHKLERLGL